MVAAVHGPEAGYQGGLGAILRHAGHTGWESGTQGGPMGGRGQDSGEEEGRSPSDGSLV